MNGLMAYTSEHRYYFYSCDDLDFQVRRELNQRQIDDLKKRMKDPSENLSAYSREDLEGEVRNLRYDLSRRVSELHSFYVFLVAS